MKTILEWYEELPSPIKEQAIENYDGANKYACCLSEAIVRGFGWWDSLESDKYWSNIYNKLENGKPLIEDDKENHIVDSNKKVEFEEGEIVEVNCICEYEKKDKWEPWTFLFKNKYGEYICLPKDEDVNYKNEYARFSVFSFKENQIRKLQKTTVTEATKVTKQEIAEWKGCDVNDLIIKE